MYFPHTLVLHGVGERCLLKEKGEGGGGGGGASLVLPVSPPVPGAAPVGALMEGRPVTTAQRLREAWCETRSISSARCHSSLTHGCEEAV